MVLPSGLTSSDVQVPSVVVKLMVRCGFSGRLLYSSYLKESFLVESVPGDFQFGVLPAIAGVANRANVTTRHSNALPAVSLVIFFIVWACEQQNN